MKKSKSVVIKFGGSSLACAENIKAAAQIIKSNQNARIIVVSAPGKYEKHSIKVTDALLYAHLHPSEFDVRMNYVKSRFMGIIKDLDINFNLDSEWAKILEHYRKFKSKSYLLSRGEQLCAKIMAAYLDIPFVDASELIIFSPKGKVLKSTYKNIQRALSEYKRFIMPGYYGAGLLGKIKVMSRGGSDITGSIAAKAISADKYLNYTDVDGVYSVSPEISSKYKKIKSISYKDLSFLSFYGANVLHYKCEKFSAAFKTRILNTFNPESPGTLVVSKVFSKNAMISCTYGFQLEYSLSKVEQLIRKSKCEILYKFYGHNRKVIGIRTIEGFTDSKKLQKALNLCEKTSKIAVYGIINNVAKSVSKINKEHKNLILCSNCKNQTLLIYKD